MPVQGGEREGERERVKLFIRRFHPNWRTLPRGLRILTDVWLKNQNIQQHACTNLFRALCIGRGSCRGWAGTYYTLTYSIRYVCHGKNLKITGKFLVRPVHISLIVCVCNVAKFSQIAIFAAVIIHVVNVHWSFKFDVGEGSRRGRVSKCYLTRKYQIIQKVC